MKNQGFTVVELMVTVVVAAIFAGSLYQLFTTYNYFVAAARQESVADDLAYSYVQKYTRPDVATSTWFTCDTTSGSGNTNDLTQNNNAPGSTIEHGTLSGDAVGLPDPVSYSVTAEAPYGCSGGNASNPIRVDAEVTYGLTGRVVHHVQYTAGVN